MNNPLPEQLQEWLGCANRFKTADLYTRDDFMSLIPRLSEAEIAEMGEVYKKVVRENSIRILKQWLLAHRGQIPMSREERAFRNILYLWRRLNTQGRIPFSKGPALDVDEDCPPTFDWSKLPVNMSFLADAATWGGKFSYTHSEEGREIVTQLVTLAERKDLERVADGVRKVGYKYVRSWLRQYLGYHIEAYLISNLIGVLDALDLVYYDPQ